MHCADRSRGAPEGGQMRHSAKVTSLAMALAMTSEMAPLASAQTPPPAPPAQQQTQGPQPQTRKQQNYSRARGAAGGGALVGAAAGNAAAGAVIGAGHSRRQEKRGIVH